MLYLGTLKNVYKKSVSSNTTRSHKKGVTAIEHAMQGPSKSSRRKKCKNSFNGKKPTSC